MAAKKAGTKKSAKKKNTRTYGKGASDAVEETMHEFKRGTLRSGRSGAKVKSRKQAVAIGLSVARKAGDKVPKKAPKRVAKRKTAKKRASS